MVRTITLRIVIRNAFTSLAQDNIAEKTIFEGEQERHKPIRLCFRGDIDDRKQYRRGHDGPKEIGAQKGLLGQRLHRFDPVFSV